MKGMREILALFVGIIALGGCTNQFLASYQGARFDAGASATAVSARPAGVGLIGTSTFVSAGSFGGPEAIKAADAVGADYVQWSKGLDAAEGPAGAGVVKASLSPTGPVSSWAPVQPGQFLYRYVARFYKTGAKDSAEAVELPAVPEADAEQLKDDEQAASQQAPVR
ncbi:MAG: hypothetical protein EXS03_06845 [Phycisphaerales bacterium]|nr:hypothetical protein [Phycisphaerales bacterium]